MSAWALAHPWMALLVLLVAIHAAKAVLLAWARALEAWGRARHYPPPRRPMAARRGEPTA